jgi:hypothetical protein
MNQFKSSYGRYLGNCSKEHSRTVDDAVDEVLDSLI